MLARRLHYLVYALLTNSSRCLTFSFHLFFFSPFSFSPTFLTFAVSTRCAGEVCAVEREEGLVEIRALEMLAGWLGCQMVKVDTTGKET